MNGHYATPAKLFGADEYVMAGSFATNGTTSPTSAMLRKPLGLNFTVAYSATGIYTVTFPSNLKLPAIPYHVEAHLNGAVADWAAVTVTGVNMSAATPNIVLALHRAGTAQAPPANGNGASVHFKLVFTNSTGC